MADSSTKDLTYRIVSTTAGDGFTKSAEEAHKAAEELDRLLTKAEEVDHTRAEVRAKADTGEAEAKLKALEGSARDAGDGASDAGGGFGGLAAKMGMVSAGAGVVGPALAALPAMFAGAAAGIGVLTLGLGGVISALHSYSQAQSSPGISGAQLAATAFANATAIRGAQEAISQARQSAAWQAASAVDTLTSAEERLGNAEQTAQNATEALNRARQDQVRTMIQLNEQAATAALDVKGAELAVAEAKQQQIATDNSLTATALDRQKAAFAVEQAENNLINVQERANETAQDAATANAKGVEGSQQVVAAKQAEANAQQGVGDAQRALVATQRQIAEQQITSNQAVAKAVQNLADIQKQQALAMAAQQASGASGMSAFNKEMAKLTPTGREVVNTILGMRGGLDQLKATSQNAIGPGVLSFLSGVVAMGPTANGALRDMGGAVGGVFTQFGNLMRSPAFQGALSQVFREGAGLATQLGTGLTGMVDGITKAGAAAGPIVSGLGKGFQVLMSSGIPKFFQNLTDNASGTGKTIQGILGVVTELLGPLGTLISAIGSALAPAMQVLTSPQVQQALIDIGTALAQIVTVLAPVITMFAQGLAGALEVVAPVLQAVAKYFEDNHKWLVPLAEALAAATAAWWLLNAAMDANPLVLVIGLVAGLAAGVIYLWEHFKGFRDFIGGAWDVIKLGFSEAIGWIEGKWNTFTGLFDPSKWGDGVHHMWDWIKDSFKWAINIVIGWWDDLNFTLPSVHIPGFGDIGGGTIGLPQIPKLATGGTALTDGLAVVGEKGPELVRLGAGAQVIPNQQSAALLGGHGPSMDGFTATIIMRLPSGEQIDQQLVTFQRQGGVLQSVQTGALAAFGAVPR